MKTLAPVSFARRSLCRMSLRRMSLRRLSLPLLSLSLASLSLASLAAGCSADPPSITVAAQKLVYVGQGFGQVFGAPLFCDTLDSRGQFEVLITDFDLCSTLKPMANNQTLFHSGAETNLRLVFSSYLKRVPKTNTFTVGKTADCKNAPAGAANATAFFSHNTTNTYDLHDEADSGTITVNEFDGMSDGSGNQVSVSEMKGSFNLMFGSDNAIGSFDALFCKNLSPGLGK